MKRMQGGLCAECDLVVDLFKSQQLDGVLFPHDSLHDIGNGFANVVVCDFTLDNVIAMGIVCLAAAGNDHIQPLHARTVKSQKPKLLCGFLVPFIHADNGMHLGFGAAALNHGAAFCPSFDLRLNIRGVERKAKIETDFRFENARLRNLQRASVI